MTALKILGVLLLLLLLLGLTRLGVVAAFGDETRVTARIGVFRLTVYPRKAGKRPKTEKAAKNAPKNAEPDKRPRPSLCETRELLEIALRALRKAARRACRRVRLDPLELTAVFGGRDPADVAMTFGAANALMHTLMPRLEEIFDIPDPSLHLRVDFDRERTETDGTLGVSLRVRDLLAIALALAVPLFRWYRRFRRSHRDDAPQTMKPNDAKEQIA